jgi:hypothetical protein
VAPIREVFVMPELMTRAEIVRRLRLVTSQRCRHRPLTMAAIAVRCGLSRMAVYRALHGDMGDDVQLVLSQVLREVDVQRMIENAAGFGREQDRPGNNGYDPLAWPLKRTSR